jgi:hypothetical protein
MVPVEGGGGLKLVEGRLMMKQGNPKVLFCHLLGTGGGRDRYTLKLAAHVPVVVKHHFYVPRLEPKVTGSSSMVLARHVFCILESGFPWHDWVCPPLFVFAISIIEVLLSFERLLHNTCSVYI